MLDWLIVGGGIHGTHLSLALTARKGVARDRVRVLDPHDAPLARWETCTGRIEMPFLRSPGVHHIDLEPLALERFAATAGGRRHRAFTLPYRRPGTALFRAHCQAVIERAGLQALRVRGSADGLRRHGGGWRVETAGGALEARNVLLAFGPGDAPHWPGWARSLRDGGCRVHHVFDEGAPADVPGRVVVVGGGITAVHLALAQARKRPGQVVLLTRHDVRVHQFDSDPGWLGPRYLAGFHAEPSPTRRRAHITAARHRGSVPPELARQLRARVREGAIDLRVGQVAAALPLPHGGSELRLETDGLQVAQVLLATGFERRRPGGPWLDAAVAELGLACAGCGFPLVDRSLRWHPGLFVTGALAELELGPAARNIAGARMAAERLLAA